MLSNNSLSKFNRTAAGGTAGIAFSSRQPYEVFSASAVRQNELQMGNQIRRASYNSHAIIRSKQPRQQSASSCMYQSERAHPNALERLTRRKQQLAAQNYATQQSL